jgi:hypothetical protein
MIMQPIKTKRTKNFILGQINHMVAGAWLGLPITYVLKVTGKNHHLVKGAFMGLFSWLMVFNLTRKIKVLTFKPNLARTHFSQMITNILFGITAAQTMVALSPNLFPDTVTLQTAGNNPSIEIREEIHDIQKEGWQYEGLVNEEDMIGPTIH